MSEPPAVLHLDAGRIWAGGQNQVRLLMHGLARAGVRQLCLCPRGSGLEARLEQESLPVVGIPWRGPGDARAILAVARRVREYDVVHCHDAHALQIAWLPGRLARVPIVASRRVHFRTSARKWNRVERVLAISETVRASLLEAGVDEDRIRLVPSGVDPAELASLPRLDPPLRQRLALPPGAKLVGNVGHLRRFKGQELIPRAAALLPDVHWAIIGTGPERERIEARVAEERVGDRVHLVGRIEDARRAIPELDLLVSTSTNEPLGTSMLDAMALGVPLIGADVAGSAEILGPVHDVTGNSLFAVGDAESLAARVRAVLASPDLARRMVEAQRARVRDFLIERTVSLTRDVYAEVTRR